MVIYDYDKYDSVWCLEYNPEERTFHHEGFRVVDIFQYITPNDLFLFRHDPEEHCLFQHRYEPDLLCELFTYEE